MPSPFDAESESEPDAVGSGRFSAAAPGWLWKKPSMAFFHEVDRRKRRGLPGSTISASGGESLYPEPAWGLDEQRADLEGDISGAGSDPADDGAEGQNSDETDSYWSLSRTPLMSLIFTLPLVVAYEGGVLLLGRGSPRNGADVWLRNGLDALGFGAYFLLPVLTVLGLLAWHHIEHHRWRFSAWVLGGMLLECLLLASVLVGLARLQGEWWPLSMAGGWAGVAARLIGFCGAGLYEEVLFRLLLLPAVIWGFARGGASQWGAAFWGVMLTSLLFSAAHYVGPLGDPFELYSFTFRTMAGLFFATLFVVRGFGIAAGTHAAYDMLVGLL